MDEKGLPASSTPKRETSCSVLFVFGVTLEVRRSPVCVPLPITAEMGKPSAVPLDQLPMSDQTSVSVALCAVTLVQR